MQLNSAYAGTSGDYTLKPVESENSKVNVDGGFYSVKGNPGEIVEIKVAVYNFEKDERQFLIQGNTAYTNSDGQPGYDLTKVTDPNLKIQLRDLFSNNKKIVNIPGNSNAVVTLKLKIPSEKYIGYLMGGVNVVPYNEKAKGTVTENGTLIKNKFSYSLPIQLIQTGANTEDVNYKINSVKPQIIDGSSGKQIGVAARVSNTNNAYIPGLSSNAVITKYGNKKFKMTASRDNQSIAPTSHYNYMVSWGKERLQAGKYHIKLTYSGNGVRTWVLDKDFVITDAQAAKYNNLAGIKPNYLWLWILLAILLLALILGLGIYMGKRNNKDNGNNNQLSSNSRRRRRRR
jgi:hypothetical protein